jgi:hypothetical protein
MKIVGTKDDPVVMLAADKILSESPTSESGAVIAAAILCRKELRRAPKFAVLLACIRTRMKITRPH